MQKQTIEVSRELLENLHKVASRNVRSAWTSGVCDELRTLLDAPVKKRPAWLDEPFAVAARGEPDAKPAQEVKQEGEAVECFAGAHSASYPSEQQQPAPADSAAGVWRDGAPLHPWGSEQFLAEMGSGQKVVLRPLPEEYSYDYTTADGTYVMRKSIRRWAQLSDSEFVPPESPVAVVLPEQTVRRAFICKGCEGVYADEAVSKCDCMCEPDFVEGEISYVAKLNGLKP